MVIRKIRFLIIGFLVFLLCRSSTITGYADMVEGSNNQDLQVLSADFLWDRKDLATEKIHYRDGKLKTSGADGIYYSFAMSFPAFDRLTVRWVSQGDMTVSLRVFDEGTGDWSEWHPIANSGQDYVHNLGGLFDFHLFQNKPEQTSVQLRLEMRPDTSVSEISLEFGNGGDASRSTPVMIAVMLIAGCVLYLRKYRGQA